MSSVADWFNATPVKFVAKGEVAAWRGNEIKPTAKRVRMGFIVYSLVVDPFDISLVF